MPIKSFKEIELLHSKYALGADGKINLKYLTLTNKKLVFLQFNLVWVLFLAQM